MNTFYAKHSAVARIWAVLTMFAVLLSAFSAPLSAYAEEVPAEEPVTEEQTTSDEGETEEAGKKQAEEEKDKEPKKEDPLPLAPVEPQAAFTFVAQPLIAFCHANNGNHPDGPFSADANPKQALLNGHDDHVDDIIPVIDPELPNGVNLTKVYAEYGGMTGQQILDADCVVPMPKKEVKISITKIICEDETLLPNDNYTEITAATAQAFLDANPSCYPGEDFEFQWAKGGVNTTEDNVGELGSPWNTTDETDSNGNVVVAISEDDLDGQTKLSVREVWNDGYIPFAGKNNGNVSAELYCAKDAANFDNLDWISGVKVDNTYHCVAWNVPEVPDPVACELTITSDEDDLVVEKNAYAKLLTTIHPAWVQLIPASVAKWIWGDDPVVAPTTVEETQTFKKSFVWNGLTIDSAILTIASDNSHAITLGAFSGGDAGEHNYAATKTYDVESAIVNGSNLLEVAVKNFGVANTNPKSNPAGLIYELKITGTGTSKDCGEVVPLEPEKPKFSTVTMCKIDGNQNALKGWNLMLLGDEVDTVEVSATTGAGTDVALDAGSYVAIASGTWDNNRGPLNIVDAEYSTEDNWVTHMDGFDGYGTEILELQVAGAFGDWGPYNSLHRYARAFTQAVDGVTNFAVSDTNYSDNTGSLDVAVYEGYAGVTGDNGCVVFEDVPFGTYNVDEIMQDGWKNALGLGEVTVDSETENFTVVNRPVDIPTEPVATVVAHKIVCTDEAELPNWGALGGADISSTTAATWVADHKSCDFEAGWEFEWAPQGTTNPDNNLPTTGLYGVAGGNWTTFGPTDINGKTQVTLTAAEIAGMSNIWMREVLKDGYIPFTYGPTNLLNDNDYTAEMYCHTDVKNFDNYDRVDGIAVDNTYHCVAWNHTPEPAPVCEVEVNLLANGGFESPVVTDGAGWDIFDLTTYPVLGWAVAWMNGGGAPALASLELHAGVNGWLPTEGDQYAELDSDFQGPGGASGEAASVAISQTVDTIAGEDYSLSWSFSPRPNTSASQNVLEVLVNNVLVATNTAAGAANTVWTPGNYVFEGTGSPVTVTFRDAGISNSEGTFLDNVSLNCRPSEGGDGEGDGDGSGDGDGDTDPTPNPTSSSSSGGGYGGPALVRATPTVAGDSISVPEPMPLTQGAQVTAVPYGAPGTGHGGTSSNTSVLSLFQILFVSRKTELTK